jgi:hypothetical protein
VAAVTTIDADCSRTRRRMWHSASPLRSIARQSRPRSTHPHQLPDGVAFIAGSDEAVQPCTEALGRQSSKLTAHLRLSYCLRPPDGNLSQHAFANALDLPAFILRTAKVDLIHGWGPTQRDTTAAKNTNSCRYPQAGKRLTLATRLQ